ncbi:Conserved_hypothetical protein [Hexamita inflata]|uniref:Uncharacterized protein n=1 Tax=Hexamita inflata TaxID=28002 RepID=A0AA86NAT8_9EUKA|nr:Conserved hypothetical protein [Hexamita inflata]
MRSHGLTQEQVIQLAQKDAKLDFTVSKTLKDSALNEHMQTIKPSDNPKMSFQEYTKNIGGIQTDNKYETLLSAHRTQKQYDAYYSDKLHKTEKGFSRPYGEFAHEIERNIDAGLIKRK